MKNTSITYNNFHFLNIFDVNELINSMRGDESVAKIGSPIQYNAIFELINNGFGLPEVIQEIKSQLENYIIINILEHTGWNKSKAAKILKINYKTLYYKMKKYSVKQS